MCIYAIYTILYISIYNNNIYMRKYLKWLLFLWECFLCFGAGKRNWCRALRSPWVELELKVQVKPRQLEFAEQSATEMTAVQQHFECSGEYLSHMVGNHWGPRQHHSREFEVNPQQVRLEKVLVHGTMGRVLRKFISQLLEIVSWSRIVPKLRNKNDHTRRIVIALKCLAALRDKA